jgi:hypothetical protein
VDSTGSGKAFVNTVIKLCVTRKLKKLFASYAMPHIGKHVVGFLSRSFQINSMEFTWQTYLEVTVLATRCLIRLGN